MVATPSYKNAVQSEKGYMLRHWVVTITGLTAGTDSVIPHGLPTGPNAPRRISYRPQMSGGWHETSSPDFSNIYISVDAGGPTSFVCDVDIPG